MKGFWFSGADKRLRYSDRRQAEIGTTHTVDGKLELCKHGLHGSKRLIDALGHAPGCILWLCEFDEVIESDSKFVARSRVYIAEYDATELLKEFARKCVLNVIDKARPYFQSPEDYQTVLSFLVSKNANAADTAYAARAAAYAAAYAATTAADRTAAAAHAAYAVTHAATATYAYTTAVDATHAAAATAADAAYAANATDEREWQNETLTQMVREATGWEI